MRILIIHKYFLLDGEAGISRFNQLARYFAGAGHKVTVLAGTAAHVMSGEKGREKLRGKFITRETIAENIDVVRTYVSSGHNKNYFRRWLSYITFLFSSLVGIFKVGGQDVVIASSPPLGVGITGYFASRIKRIPFVFEVRDLWPDFAIDAGVLKNRVLIWLARFLEWFLYRVATRVNVLTPAFGKVLKEKKKVPIEKIVYVPNGADLDLLSPGPRDNWVREKYEWHKKFVVLYVGAHGLANSLDLLIDSAKLLRDYKDILFVLVGDGMMKPKLQERVRLEFLKNVQFVDPVPKEKIKDFINAADVGTAILKKYYDTTYPNKVFDYMSCAKPIVLPIAGAAKELVVDEAKAGIFSEPENPEAFKTAVLFFYERRWDAEEYGKRGYEFVKKNFDREMLAKRYLEILLQIKKS